MTELLARHHYDPLRLVQILRDVARERGVITAADLTTLATALRLPRARVEGVAGFYSFLGTQPRGRYRVLFSDNITDEMLGMRSLRDRLCAAFDVRLGEVSRDGLVSIEETSCTGLCDQGPALLVNGHAIGRLDAARLGTITALVRGAVPIEEWPPELFVIETHVERRDLLLTSALAPGEAIAATEARGAAATLEEIKRSGLRGRGGAGFSTGAKWEACRAAPSAPRFIVCNADEGEPGTFKDRVLLMHHADELCEGMTVAARCVGAERGLIYVRGEYAFLAPILQETLARRRAAGLLGHDFELEVQWGAGAYVCGEESALLESLEGKRGIPRNRPPYPVTHGYLGQPTAVNNVETLIAAAHIARHGADWWRSRGTEKSSGTKLLSVSGDAARPGVYEFPFGVTIAEVLAAAGATATQAVQVGGPSGTLLGPRELGRRIAFEDVPSAGAFMVFDESRDLVEIVDNFARFFAHESCGFCTPCRVGTTLQRQMTGHLVAGKGTRRDLKDLVRVATLMRASSHCGLGATAGNPVLHALERFRPSFERRLASLEIMPSFDLDESLAPAREITGREDAHAHLAQTVDGAAGPKATS